MNEIEEKEDLFYSEFLDKAISYCRGEKKTDGIQVRNLIAAAGVVSRQKQTRGAMKALQYQILRDTGSGLIEDKRKKLKI